MRTLYAADIRDNPMLDGFFLIASKQHGIARNGAVISRSSSSIAAARSKREFWSAPRIRRPAWCASAAVKHMLVNYHGPYEFGSPKLPQTREAVILHSSDDLAGKIQAMQNLPEKEPVSKWTVFHCAYGRVFIDRTQSPLAACERTSTGGTRT